MSEQAIVKKELQMAAKHKRPITLDVNYREKAKHQKIFIFCHGFKGFKDWGAFNHMAKAFASLDFFFVKINFSHNGTSPSDMSDIHDLNAFGHNNFEIELDDLKSVIDWLYLSENPFKAYYDLNQIHLVGHSRGGGIAMLTAEADSRVTSVAAWASVNDFEKYMYLSDPVKWKNDGVSYVENLRTGIKLPLLFQFYENFYANKHRFDIKENLMRLSKPLLLLHGTNDETVPLADAEWLYENIDHSILIKIENANHTFGISHPWLDESMHESLSFAIEETAEFFNF